MNNINRRMKQRALVVVWALVIALDVASLFSLARLRFTDGLQNAFASETREYRNYRRHAAEFTQTDADVVVLFRSKDFANADDLGRVADFALEAQFIEGVSEAFSIYSVRSDPGGDNASGPLIPARLPPQADLRRLLDGIAANDIVGGGGLISADRSLTAVLLTISSEDDDFRTTRAVLSEIRNLAQSSVTGRDMTFSVTGFTVLREVITDNLVRDMWLLTAVGAVTATLVCIAALRSLSIAMLTLMPAGTGLLWALGALSALGFQINVISIALPLLVLVLAFTDSLHLSFENRRLFEATASAMDIALEATRRVGPACALATLTTALAFGGLLVSGSLAIRELGMAGMTAMLVSLAAVLIAHPLLFATVPGFIDVTALYQGNRGVPPSYFNWRFLYELSFSRPALVSSATVVILVAAVAAYLTVKPVYSFFENVDPQDEAALALDEIDRNLVPTGSIDVPVRLTGDIEGGLGATNFQRIAAVHDAVKRVARDNPVVSLASFASEEVDSSKQAERLDSVIEQMSPFQRGRFLSANGDLGLVRVYTSDWDAADTREFVTNLKSAMANFEGLDFAGGPSGFLTMAAVVSASMITDLNLCFLFAVAASGLLTVLWFRNVIYGLVALIPNVLPIAAIGAYLAISGQGLQFSSGIALTIAFGIAVDDTAHVLNRLKLNAPPRKPFDQQAIRQSMTEVTPILVITTAVLSLGLVGTFISSVPAVAYFGAVSIAALLLALMADLAVLPAWLKLMSQWDVTGTRAK